MTKRIPVVNPNEGYWCYVDDKNYTELNQYRWYPVHSHNGKVYAARNYKNTNLYMHREIMNAKKGEQIDHKDNNGLNNVEENLRHATPSQNSVNKDITVACSSIYRGVSWYIRYQKWMASINRPKEFLGYFVDEEEAARAYDKRAKELWGDFARLNFP